MAESKSNYKSDWEDELRKMDSVDFKTNVQQSFHVVLKTLAIVADVTSQASSTHNYPSGDDSWEQGDGWDYGDNGTGFYLGGYRIK